MLLVLTSVGAVAISGRAEVATVEHDNLHDRLDAARAEVERIQAEADSVEEQIKSIGDQAAAVAEALKASRQLVARTQAGIGLLERDVALEEQIHRRVQQRVEDLAVSLYKMDAPPSSRCC